MSHHPKNGLPSDEVILARRADFQGYLARIKSGDIKLSARNTVTNKLKLLSNELRELVEVEGITYTIIKEVLQDKFGLSVSTQSLRKYCQDELGIPKRVRSDNSTDTSRDTPKAIHRDEPSATVADPVINVTPLTPTVNQPIIDDHKPRKVTGKEISMSLEKTTHFD